MPPIGYYLASSLIEWPGYITASVVMQGCNFRCPFCHSRDFVPVKPPEHEIPLEWILKDIRKRHGWVDAVVVSGGEPCIHAELPEMLRLFKESRVLVKLDTNGTYPEMLEQVINEKLVDLVAMDVKAPLDQRYVRATGVKANLDNVRRSIDILLKHPEIQEFRTTYVPGIHGEPEALDIAKTLEGAALYYVQGFIPHNTLDEAYMSVDRFALPELKRFAEIAAPHIKRVEVRGEDVVFTDGKLITK
jgi:pyruvate formate lyase activating enzyme